ncbi:ABC transporter permease [Cellulomonas shaoxiangyii]|uniref:Polyketide antibiotic transporter n=1 Tax=Cellulomonas shaoxiangyii TaxID=2566013 RepID=A0A4P7SNM9_9CELL|nr:polyketide antibiotic transporter [Cellulomonas shaoxiangyii]QCB94876.1 polyketide antibiotic transporter [Cellulomonas shaoxiangyii]TGY85105.1 polyketide antibiotic transporter [Cellulomonas shaoxiangyii]
MTAATLVRTSAPADGGGWTGTGTLLRVALRRDRLRLAVWAVALGGLVTYFVAALPAVYPDAASRQARAAIMREPSGALMSGPGFGLDDYTVGVMVANELLGMLAVAAALMSSFLVVRHTRAEEEAGRLDLVLAGAVGRRAPLTAALLTALVANAVVAAALLAALLPAGLAVPDSVAVAGGVAAVGLVLAGVAAVAAQLTTTARGANGLAGAVVGLAFVLRGVGDARQRGGSALSWASPIGWAQQSRAFVELRWWPLLLCLALAAALVVLASALARRRDVGAGLLPERRGRATAGPLLRSPLALVVRLERTAVVAWAAGLAVMAALTGSLVEGVVDSFADDPELAAAFGATGADVVLGMLSAFVGFFAMAVTVFAVATVLRMGREEARGRTATVLAAPVGRPAWMGAHLAVALAGSAGLLAVGGAALGAGAQTVTGDRGLVGDLGLAALGHLPVVAAFAAVAALVHALRAPAWAVWVPLAASIVVGLYGGLLDLPRAVLDAVPFAILPALPADAFAAAPVAAVTGAALAIGAAAVALYRRRDLVA